MAEIVSSRNPGVRVSVHPRKLSSGSRVWLARWVDPHTHALVERSLRKLGVTSRTAAEAWAARKSQELEADAPTPRTTCGPEPRVAREELMREKGLELTPKTMEGYRSASKLFTRWLERQGIDDTLLITPEKLTAYRAVVIARRLPDGRPRSQCTANKELREVRALLEGWRRRGYLAVTKDQLSDVIRSVRTLRRLPKPLSVNHIRQLMTAAEEAGHGLLIRTALLTGCRIGELAALTWRDVGEGTAHLRVRAEVCKTLSERLVPLDIAPKLRAELESKARRGQWVFGTGKRLTTGQLRGIRKQVVRAGAEPFTWHDLRKTCSSYMVNSRHIFGAASIWEAARRLGHHPDVAMKHYNGVVEVCPDAKDLEEAMGL